ncbi:MAG: ABC transporter substrate-binding protein [bacterium]
MRRSSFTLAAAAVVALVLALGTGALAKVEVTLWGWPSADKAFEAMMAGFQEKYPDIKVKVEMMSWADTHNKLLSSLAAGAGAPDISMIEINFIDKFAAKGGLTNLLEPPFNAGKYESEFVAYKWKQATTPDGRLIALPWDIGPATLFYRRDIFEKSGLPSDPEGVGKLLKTWRDYIAVGKKITNPAKQVWMLDNASSIFMIYFSHKNLFDKDYNVAVDNEKSLRILKYAQEARRSGIDARVGTWTPEWNAMFPGGNLATQICGCWFGGFLKTWLAPETGGKWGIVYIPEDPGQNWGGSFLAIPQQGRNKREAWAFVEYSMATARSQNEMFLAVDYFPAYIPAWKDPLYQESDPFFAGQKTRAMWIEVTKITPPMVTTPMDHQAETILGSHITTALDQNLDPKEALKKAAEEIKKQTAQDREMIMELLGRR